MEAFFSVFFFLSIVLALPRDADGARAGLRGTTRARARACRPLPRGPLMRVPPSCTTGAARHVAFAARLPVTTAVVVGVPVGVGGIPRRRAGATAEERRARVLGRRLTPAPARAAARGAAAGRFVADTQRVAPRRGVVTGAPARSRLVPSLFFRLRCARQGGGRRHLSWARSRGARGGRAALRATPVASARVGRCGADGSAAAAAAAVATTVTAATSTTFSVVDCCC